MIARFQCVLPFSLFILSEAPYKVYEINDSKYRIRFWPPMKSNIQKRPTDPSEIKINDKTALVATALQIDFIANDFLREKSNKDTDPPQTIINHWINDLISRIKFVSNNSNIMFFELSETSWQLTYLNDDETEVPETPTLRRKWDQKQGITNFNPVIPEMWEDAHKLSNNFVFPIWKSLLHRSITAFPDTGVALVTAATALEVFMSSILDLLASRSSIPENFWRWAIHERSREPSLDEQFSELLKLFTNKSLKDEPKLWQGYKNLYKARNSYVHGGIPFLDGQKVDQVQARKLVNDAVKIIDFVRESLPEDLRWPLYEYKTEMLATIDFENSYR